LICQVQQRRPKGFLELLIRQSREHPEIRLVKNKRSF
jgi:hypothetical protein